MREEPGNESSVCTGASGVASDAENRTMELAPCYHDNWRALSFCFCL